MEEKKPQTKNPTTKTHYTERKQKRKRRRKRREGKGKGNEKEKEKEMPGPATALSGTTFCIESLDLTCL